MAVAPILQQAVELSRTGDIEGALKLLLEHDEPLDDEHSQAFVYLMLKSRPDLDDALALVNKKIEGAQSEEQTSLWTLRRGLLYLDRDDKMRAMVDLNQVARKEVNPDHADQARRALGRCLDPDPPRDGNISKRRYRG
jgi:hypothetical protein